MVLPFPLSRAGFQRPLKAGMLLEGRRRLCRCRRTALHATVSMAYGGRRQGSAAAPLCVRPVLRWSHFLPQEDGPAFFPIEVALVRRRGDRQRVPVELVEPNLIGSRPSLVPGDIDVV